MGLKIEHTLLGGGCPLVNFLVFHFDLALCRYQDQDQRRTGQLGKVG